MTIAEKLLKIQVELKAPKSQYNNFGKYYYRNCEDILEAVKPLADKNKCILTISDDIVDVNNRFYVRATARLSDIESAENISTTAFAREEESKKGMDGSQVTGAASSYARKYALNGLFCIDDTNDADSADNSQNGAANSPKPPVQNKKPPAQNKPTNQTVSQPKTPVEYSKLNWNYCNAIAEARGITAELVLENAKNSVNSEDAEQICKFLCGEMRKIKQ